MVNMIFALKFDPAQGKDGWLLTKFWFALLWTEAKSRSIKMQPAT